MNAAVRADLSTDTMPESGLYADGGDHPWLPPQLYHKSSRLSRSALVTLLRSTPAHFAYERGHAVEATDAMVRGDAIHAAVLEPERFATEYLLPPSHMDRRLKADKELWAALEAEAVSTGKRLLQPSHVEPVTEIARAVREHPALRDILRGPGLTEASAAWETDDGVALRCRPDRAFQDQGGEAWLMDLKSADGEAAASPEAFARQIAQRRLHVQAALYCTGMTAATGTPHERFGFIVYEVQPPYACAVYRLEDDAIAQGRSEIAEALHTYRACRDADRWPDYAGDGDVRLIGLPRWYARAGDDAA